MPAQLTSYKIFIASPGGLEKERQAFRDTVQSHNNTDALARECHFNAVGWEFTLAGMGRPQEKINKELESCDFFILLLWDRWGSTTGSPKGYTSGTEEEYKLAREFLTRKDRPMKEITVLFKAVDQRQLSDPGVQLQKVLAFKKELEEEKALLYETFDSVESFVEKIRRHLAKWTRDHEQEESGGEVTATLKPLTSSVPDLGLSVSKDDPSAEKIEAIYRKGNLSEAEQILVSELAATRSLQSFHNYGLFLIKAGRWADARSVYDEMYRLALINEDFSWATTAICRVAGIQRQNKKPHDAMRSLETAVALSQKSKSAKSEMYPQIWLGDVTYQIGLMEKSKLAYEKALELAQEFGTKPITADIYFKLAKVLVNLHDVEKGTDAAQKAVDLFFELNDSTSLTAVKHWRKSKGVALIMPARRTAPKVK